ncbi:hypothetical protein AN189_07950 [Loktanella sp. 3ANDIMAR09]|uniref:hypothetical protein n=1 Tax=Loktanella sp. 3ANDIMAR09 TaxID=1225657 RepID=UPI0007083117|nr:hypothetical protein [Loktanella sp. 3ANDIMAR09]KQI68801.1 hypothetical protein AN189_07950 [Loktanella sp. 3ANDIMAR09]
MKLAYITAAAAVFAMPAIAQDYKFTVTNNSEFDMAPLIVLDSALSDPLLFADGGLSEEFKGVALEGDPRPMNGKVGAGVAGPVFGTSGPPEVWFAPGETGSADMFIESNTLRFYAKLDYADGADTIVSGVYDIAMGDGTIQLDLYDTGISEGTNEITRVAEGVVEVVIIEN